MVGFADQQYETQTYVLLQRTLHPSEQDKAMGQDGVHIMVNDPSRSVYGGIKRIELLQDEVVIGLDPEAKSTVNAATEIRIGIGDAQADLDELSKMLSVLCDRYVEFNAHL